MTTNQSSSEEDFLKRSLYVYDLPTSLLQSLILKGESFSTNTTIDGVVKNTNTTAFSCDNDGSGIEIANATSCALCGIPNKALADQRAHIKSDFHRFNLKLKLRGESAVPEAEFEQMLGDLNESISGSESDSDSGSDTDNLANRLSTLVRRKAAISSSNQTDDLTSIRRHTNRDPGNVPLIWFTSPLIPSEVSLGVYRALFTDAEQTDGNYLNHIHGRQLSPQFKAPHVFLCMIGGGHFAAMIVSLGFRFGRRHTGAGLERQAIVLEHKTFHRYTTRRKQGGSQSTNDNSKGHAQSAGAALRRHNEVALINEVRELLASWKELIDSADFLFVRASGSANKRTLFSYDKAVLRSNDPRLRSFPFTTRRATQNELMRCFVELTRFKISRISESSLSALPSMAPTTPTIIPKPKSPVPKVSPEDETALLHTTQLITLIRRSKAAAAASYITTHSLPQTFRFFPEHQHHHAPTPLHLAASLNLPPVVTALITGGKGHSNNDKIMLICDPTTQSMDGKVPFDLAGERVTRDAFRVARSELGETICDWDLARVPAPLSKTEAEKRDRREKEESEKGERERREREMRRLAAEAEKSGVKVNESGRALGSRGVLTGMNKREVETRGLAPEALARLERERRARAAEERFRKMQGRGTGNA